LGKTHLLHAICNHFKQVAPRLRWKYVTGEDFTNDYLYCLRNGKMDFFNERYRGLDALIIDDVHFLANKKATQDGFLHTFKAIDAGGKQIVLASDAHPRLITSFSESLTSRFLAGMVARVDAPDLPVRINVLRRKAARIKADIGDAVLQHIAERFDSNVRELEGALLKVVALAQISNKPVTPAMVDQSLRELVRCVSPAVKLNDIENTVSIYFGLRTADLHTSKKSRTIALARGIAMYLARKHTDMSFPEIGRFMGKNHTTVILAARRIGESMAANETVQWISAGGPRTKNINAIMQEIEAQTGIAPLREASMPASLLQRSPSVAEGSAGEPKEPASSAVLGAA
jgi:chromosomal replication initiator protein